MGYTFPEMLKLIDFGNYVDFTSAAVFVGVCTLSLVVLLWKLSKHTKGKGESEVQQTESFADDPELMRLHIMAARSYHTQAAAECYALLHKYPEAVNNALPPIKYTPFLRACRAGNYRLIKFMLKIGADVNSQTSEGDNAIYLAVHCLSKRHGNWDPRILNMLYKYGCDVNSAKQHGYTPLHLAARNGHIELTKWLLVHGADPARVTHRGHKPVDIAKLQGHQEVVKLLTVNTGTETQECNHKLCDVSCKCDCHSKKVLCSGDHVKSSSSNKNISL